MHQLAMELVLVLLVSCSPSLWLAGIWPGDVLALPLQRLWLWLVSCLPHPL